MPTKEVSVEEILPAHIQAQTRIRFFVLKWTEQLVSKLQENYDAKIFLKEPLGDITILDLSIKDTKLKMILPEEEAINYDTGQNIKISFNIDNSYLFASDTGVSALN